MDAQRVPIEPFGTILDDHIALAERLRALGPKVRQIADACCAALARGNKLLFCGNGGSAADSQHLATEIIVRFETKRRALPALALTTDTSALTAASNDFGIEQMFARQVAALGRAGDVLIGLTTSGTSPNVLVAFRAAREIGVHTICLTGRDGGQAKELSDICLIVPSDSTARIQEMHIIIGHAICASIDIAFT